MMADQGIDVKNKTGTLINLTTEVVQESFAANFASSQDCNQVIENIEKLSSQAMDFISDIKSLEDISNLIGHDYQTHTHSIKVGWLTATFINANPDLFGGKNRCTIKGSNDSGGSGGFSPCHCKG